MMRICRQARPPPSGTPATPTRSSATTGGSFASLVPGALYVTFNYDDYGPMKMVVRGIILLDYTPGGPDFRPDLFGSGRSEFGLLAQVDIGGHDEVHAETGDDTVYAAGGN